MAATCVLESKTMNKFGDAADQSQFVTPPKVHHPTPLDLISSDDPVHWTKLVDLSATLPESVRCPNSDEGGNKHEGGKLLPLAN